MASAIDATKPTAGSATTQSMRDNFAAAKSEIEALQAGTGLASGSVVDAAIGTRTPDQAVAAVTGAGTLTQVFNWFANRIKAISGETNWYDAVGTSLKSHVANTSNPHGVTATQVSNTPAGSIAASTVQAAINELDTEKANIAGSASTVFSAAAPTAAANVQRWDTPNMASITVTQATGALTFAGVAHPITFRSATLTDGAVSTVIADPADLVLPSGGTLGFVTTVQGRIVVAEMNNGGTSEYAICNIAGGLQMDETNLISTTAIADTSDAENVWYSTTARSNLPYKIVGAVDVVNTAGAWGNPILVQPAGGNAKLKSVSMVRVHTANGYGSTNTMIRRFTTVVADIGDDITYADSATNGASFTINTADFYTVSFSDTFNAAQTLGISLNSTQLTTSISAITAADRLCSQDTGGTGLVANCATRVWCNVGDIIRPHTSGQASGAGPSSTNFTITRG